MPPITFRPTDPCRYGNKMQDNMGYNLASIKMYPKSLNLTDIFKIGLLKGVSNFYHD